MGISKDYVVRLYFDNGTHEQVKYEGYEDAIAAYDSITEHVKSEGMPNSKRVGEIVLPDGTKFSFKVSALCYWKIFKYTKGAYEEVSTRERH